MGHMLVMWTASVNMMAGFMQRGFSIHCTMLQRCYWAIRSAGENRYFRGDVFVHLSTSRLCTADVPYDLTPKFLDELLTKHRIDYVIHGDDPCILPGA
jgi:hypothetical protein